MLNNDILRRLRYTFNLSDSEMIGVFAQADTEVSRAQVSDWLRKEEDEGFIEMEDVNLAIFLNGFINLKRGKRDGEQPTPETRLNNNLILRKLKIALNLKDEDILQMLKSVDFRLSPHELSAFFRNPEHRKYVQCQDQILRNFLHGLQLKYNPK